MGCRLHQNQAGLQNVLGKPVLEKIQTDLNEVRDDGVLGCSGISWTMQMICTLLQTDNHTNTTSLNFFRGQMLFLMLNQQCQSTEGNFCEFVKKTNLLLITVSLLCRMLRGIHYSFCLNSFAIPELFKAGLSRQQRILEDKCSRSLQDDWSSSSVNTPRKHTIQLQHHLNDSNICIRLTENT